MSERPQSLDDMKLETELALKTYHQTPSLENEIAYMTISLRYAEANLHAMQRLIDANRAHLAQLLRQRGKVQ